MFSIQASGPSRRVIISANVSIAQEVARVRKFKTLIEILFWMGKHLQFFNFFSSRVENENKFDGMAFKIFSFFLTNVKNKQKHVQP